MLNSRFWKKKITAEKISKTDYFENSRQFCYYYQLSIVTWAKKSIFFKKIQHFRVKKITSNQILFCSHDSFFLSKTSYRQIPYKTDWMTTEKTKIELCINLLGAMSVRLPWVEFTLFVFTQLLILIQIFRHFVFVWFFVDSAAWN